MELIQLFKILIQRKWVFIFSFLLFCLVVIGLTHIIHPTFKAEALVLIQESEPLSSFLNKFSLKSSQTTSTDTTDIETDIIFATAIPLLNDVILELDLKDRRGNKMPAVLLKKYSLVLNKLIPQPYVEVEQAEESYILKFVATSPDRDECVSIANTLARHFIQKRVQLSAGEFKEIGKYIEDNFDAIRDGYYQTQREMLNFVLKENAVDLDAEIANTIKKIQDFELLVDENQIERLGYEQELIEIDKNLAKLGKYRKESTENALNTQINTLKSTLAASLVDIASKAVELTEEHPSYQKVEQEISTLRKLIKNEADMMLSRENFSINPSYDTLTKRQISIWIDNEILKTKNTVLKMYIKLYQDRLMTLPNKTALQSRLSLELDKDKEFYDQINTFLSPVKLAESLMISKYDIIEPATRPLKPHFPKKALNYALAVLVGFFWAILCACLADYVDMTIRACRDLKGTAFVCLGSIPQKTLTGKGTLIHQLPANHAIPEAVRSIRNAVTFAAKGPGAESIVVTSCLSKEGKSTVAANLAISFAQSGHKTLLVELDFRRPSLRQKLNLPETEGITDVLTDNLAHKNAVKSTSIKGLDIILSGPPPENPGQIIDSGELKQLINILEPSYDRIVFDSPSLFETNDPVVITRNFAKTLVLVVNAGKVTVEMLERVSNQADIAGIHIAGAVINRSNRHF